MRGRCWGSSRATTQFYPTGSVVMLKPGSGVKRQSNGRRGVARYVVQVSRESPVKMETRDESEPSDQLGPVGEKRANRFALRSLLRIPLMRVCHRSEFEVPVLFAVSLLLCSCIGVMQRSGKAV